MDLPQDFCRIHHWYPRFSADTFPMTFVWLSCQEVEALAEGEITGAAANAVIARLEKAMNPLPNLRFVSVDLAAPVDVPRFQSKRGAVHSAASAWNMLATSQKIRELAAAGEVRCICVRPFRRMDIQREFRLFIYEGELKAMSQYWLVQHFPWLAKRKEKYWSIGQAFVERNRFAFPAENFVMDIYVTSSDHVRILDLNPFGGDTDPLMLNHWDYDWSLPGNGIHIVPPPRIVKGNVNVSF